MVWTLDTNVDSVLSVLVEYNQLHFGQGLLTRINLAKDQLDLACRSLTEVYESWQLRSQTTGLVLIQKWLQLGIQLY